VKYIWRTAFLLSLLAWIFTLILRGYISLPFGIFALIVLIILRAIGGNHWTVLVTFDIGITIASFLTAATNFVGGDLIDLTGFILLIWVVWFFVVWLYYNKFGHISFRASIAVVLGPIIWLIPLLSEGNIPLLVGLAVGIVFIIFRAVGQGKNWRHILLVFALGIPIVSLLTSGVFSKIISTVGVLVIVLIGLYIMLSGFFSSRRRG